MDHLIDDEEIPKHERELTLSTGAILGIFLGLVVLCGGFFGFGYNMGRKSAPTPLNLSDVATTDPTLPANSSTSNPAAGSPLDDTSAAAPPVGAAPKPDHRTPPPVADATADTDDSATAAPKPTRTPPTPTTPAPIVRQPAPVSPSALNPSAATAGGTFMVQVAAVSHQEDADLLVGALRARGYAVTTRSSSADSFIHVQVGPFHDKKDADAMRQRLLTDGYNAIVK